MMIRISIVLSGLFLYLALRDLEWHAFFTTLQNAQYAYVPLVFLWSTLSYLMRALRWRVLLSSEKLLPASNVFWANMSGYLGNSILPARAGEFVRAAYLAKRNEMRTSFVLATGLAERLVDVIALVILGSFSLVLIGITSQEFQTGLAVMTVLGISGLGMVLISPHFGGLTEKAIARIPYLSADRRDRCTRVMQQFLRGLQSLIHFKRAAIFALFTALIWLMDGLGVVILSRALYLPLNLPQASVLLAGLGLSSAIPSTPGYIGVYQFVAVAVLEPFGISRADAVALVLFSQVLGLFVALVWGGLALWRVSRNLLNQSSPSE